MNIAAEMMSIFEAVSAGISVENCSGSTTTVKPASLPTALTRSTITPWMVLVLVSRNVKGRPVGVAPTLRGWALTAFPRAPRRSADDRHRLANRLLIVTLPSGSRITRQKPEPDFILVKNTARFQYRRKGISRA